MSRLKPVVSSRDHVQGNANAPVELVEYGDYQCPHCGRAYPIIKHIQERMGSRLKFVFRNFPLAEVHPNATNAAIASEAAARQGKFWEMHDMMYEHQRHIEDTDLMNYARSIGLNIEKFKTDFDSEDVQKKVGDDFESGIRSGVNGTPSFFINGEKYSKDWEEETLLRYLQSISQQG